MLIFVVENILRFLRSCSLLTHVGEMAHMECSESKFSLTISHTNNSHSFISVLEIKPLFFLFYQPSVIPLILSWNIPMKKLCDHLRQGIPCSSMHFILQNPPLATLQFHANSGNTNNTLSSFSKEIMLSRPENRENVGNINKARFVSIDSQQFRRIVMKFRNMNKAVNVTFNNLRVTFSSGDKKITLKKEHKECIIEGVVGNERIDLSIKLHPTTFFSDLTFWAERVWFYETTEANSVIYAPVDMYVRFQIYFPPSR